MAYDPRAEYKGHLKRIARDLLVFSGRSQRTELAVYLVVAVLVSSLIGMLFPWWAHLAQLLAWLPFTPLLARRLHDLDRSGWFAAIVPILIGLRAWDTWQFQAGHAPAPGLEFLYNAIGMALVIAFWAIFLWPGTQGTNRFGPDPRLVDVGEMGSAENSAPAPE